RDQERRRAERVGRHRRVDARAAKRHLFLHEAVVETRAAQAAVRLRDLDVHEARLPRLLEDLARELAGLVVVRRLRDDLFSREVARGLGEGLLFFAEAQVHGPRTISRLVGGTVAAWQKTSAPGGSTRSSPSAAWPRCGARRERVRSARSNACTRT